MRAAYSAQRAVVRRFKPEGYLAVRLLVPPELVPHVVVATAFMHRTDDLLDSGPVEQRRDAFGAWERDVRAGLRGERTAQDPLVRALASSCGLVPPLGERVSAFLDTALTDLDFSGFATEADYQDYLDAYSLPAVLVASVLTPLTPEMRVACRAWIDGGQRLDSVTDLAEDLAAGRLTVPQETLAAFSVTRDDLAAARDTPAVRALLTHLLDLADDSLAKGAVLAELTRPASRPMVRALLGLDDLTARAARAKGAALLRDGARPSVPGALRLLLREVAAR
ncbi:phytoene/squalene synthetase [Streptacidiphilus pinicola]|uniref:Phytoene/squalene synthetase n=1 Tax=Streptacidiphilus pinicola TaxID=2219663 RepID=A0A2X0IEH0_9ACTN|nr:phytoene/squalene synthetase [Streptacidiphilus pinicola]